MPDADPLEDQAAIVTGASSGIGEATARALARDGARVTVAARRGDRLETVARTIESESHVETNVVPTDVTDPDAVEEMVRETISAFGRIDVVVSNAGVFRSGDVEKLPTEAYRNMMAVNTDGQFFTARAALSHLRETNGTLVFVGSNAGTYPYPPSPVYGATKWWLRGFAHSLATSVGEDLSISIVNPSTTRTEIGRQDGTPNREQFGPGEALDPLDVAEAIVYAVRQDHPNTVNELNYFRQDEIGQIR